MKRKSFLLATLMCAFVALFASCDKDDVRPEEKFTIALNTKYPGATNVSWDKEGNYYVADCYISGIESEIWYDKSANWVRSEFDIPYDLLPETIKNSLLSYGYSRIDIDDIDLIYEIGKDEYYDIDIDREDKDITIYMSKEGEMLGGRP